VNTHALAASPAAAAQVRLLVLTGLLLGTTLIAEGERASAPAADSWTSVFAEPPAYLHPAAAIGFDVSGVAVPAPDGVEAALLASVHAADSHTRAHAHMSLAVYYKLRGLSGLAAQEKRKGDYWLKVARLTS